MCLLGIALGARQVGGLEGRVYKLGLYLDLYAEDKPVILKFMQEVDVDFPVLLDSDGKVSAQWNVLVFPSTFVIAPDGKIVYGVKGGYTGTRQGLWK